jgi:hypothetical protein
VRPTFGVEGKRINSDIVISSGYHFSIKIDDETLISRDIERNGPVAVHIEQGLECYYSPNGGSSSFVVPYPKSAMAQVLVLVDVMEIGEAGGVAGSEDSGLQIRAGDDLRGTERK